MKLHERTVAKIDLDAIRHNTRLAKEKAEGAKLLSVVKANAYGHGAAEVAGAIADIADWFGVAIVEEGVQLRRAGITNPIQVFANPLEAQFPLFFAYNLTPSITNIKTAKALSDYAVSLNTVIDVHIGVDTGMSRVGFLYEDCAQIAALQHYSGIRVTGLCSHYATADETDKTVANKQHAAFVQFLNTLKECGIEPPVKHISNSAGIMELSGTHHDMVRAGIMTYGLYPSSDVNQNFGLQRALSWYAKISHVKVLPAGHGVSYGHTYITKKETKIATVPVGYADGYPRALSSNARVLVGGQFAPVIGRVCMDQFMIDVTDIASVETGDTVTLLGQDGEKEITVEELGKLAYSFNYEFVCGIGLRVPRVYVEGGKETKRVAYIESL